MKKLDFDERYIPEPFSGCWLWLGPDDGKRGYGVIVRGRKSIGAHRASWLIHRGKIPDGKWVLHRCDTPSCVNPDHLFIGTRLDNMRDCVTKGRFYTGGGLQIQGENNGNARLTAEQAMKIRSSNETCTVLAKRYGTSFGNICKIKARLRWKHL